MRLQFEQLESRDLCSGVLVQPTPTSGMVGSDLTNQYFADNSILNVTPTGAELLLLPNPGQPVPVPPGVQLPQMPGETGVGGGAGGGGGSAW